LFYFDSHTFTIISHAFTIIIHHPEGKAALFSECEIQL